MEAGEKSHGGIGRGDGHNQKSENEIKLLKIQNNIRIYVMS